MVDNQETCNKQMYNMALIIKQFINAREILFGNYQAPAQKTQFVRNAEAYIVAKSL